MNKKATATKMGIGGALAALTLWLLVDVFAFTPEPSNNVAIALGVVYAYVINLIGLPK